jgi:hypothetical protein
MASACRVVSIASFLPLQASSGPGLALLTTRDLSRQETSLRLEVVRSP